MKIYYWHQNKYEYNESWYLLSESFKGNINNEYELDNVYLFKIMPIVRDKKLYINIDSYFDPSTQIKINKILDINSDLFIETDLDILELKGNTLEDKINYIKECVAMSINNANNIILNENQRNFV